jgi:hypothetical protein
MTKTQRNAYILGVLTILAGALTGKFLMTEAGLALVTAGGFLLGKIQPQPRFSRHGAQPQVEILGPDDTTPVLPRAKS